MGIRGRMAAVSIFLLQAMQPLGVADEPGEWRLDLKQEGIEVYTRTVEGSDTREFRGMMDMPEPPGEVVLAFTDDAYFCEWYHQCEDAWIIEENPPDDKLLYFQLGLPWPVSDRDAVILRRRSPDPETGAMNFILSSVDGELPEQEGKVRILSLSGLWRFAPLAPAGTRVEYIQHVDAGGHLPAWLVNQLVVAIPFNTLRNFRTFAQTRPHEGRS